MKGWLNVAYMAVALGLITIGVTQLEMNPDSTIVTVFTLVWLAFALLVVAANLHEILGVDEETKHELARIRRMKYLSVTQKRIAGKIKQFQK